MGLISHPLEVSFFFLGALRGGSDLFCSMSSTLKPCFIAYSFNTWPAFFPGICSCFADCDQLMVSPVGCDWSNVILISRWVQLVRKTSQSLYGFGFSCFYSSLTCCTIFLFWALSRFFFWLSIFFVLNLLPVPFSSCMNDHVVLATVLLVPCKLHPFQVGVFHRECSTLKTGCSGNAM